MSPFPCDFRGDALPPQRCQVCGPDKDRDIEVFHCQELDRPCSIHAHGLRITSATGNTRTGPKMPVCIRCDLRTVDGVRVEPLSAVAIQVVRRQAVQQHRTACDLQLRLAENIVRIREGAKLSLTAVASAAGCNVRLLERIESAEHWPSPVRLSAIAQAPQVPPSAFFA